MGNKNNANNMNSINNKEQIKNIWKGYIKSMLKQNLNLFVEIEMLNDKTNGYIQNISKIELLDVIKNVFNENNAKYIVSTRSYGNLATSYFIVISPIQ